MSNELTTQTGLVNYNPGQATLKDMRADSTRFPRIKTLPREQVVEGMTRIVSQAFLYRGQAADPTNIHFISNALVDELLAGNWNGASNLSLAEIQVVVKRAVLGGSDMFGISVASLYKVILEYVKGEGHHYQEEIDAYRRTKEIMQEYSKSGVSAMLQATAGEMVRNNKIK